MTPESPTSGQPSWSPSSSHQAVLDALDSQIQAGPERFRDACTLDACDDHADLLVRLFSEAVEPMACAFTSSVHRIVEAATKPGQEWPQGRLARAVRRVQLIAMHAPGDFQHLVATRTDLDLDTILGPAMQAFEAAFEPIDRTVFAGVEAAFSLGCGLRAAMEARSLPDVVPSDW